MQIGIYFWYILNNSARLAMAINLPEFYTHEGSQYMKAVNMEGFWKYQGSEFVRILNILG